MGLKSSIPFSWTSTGDYFPDETRIGSPATKAYAERFAAGAELTPHSQHLGPDLPRFEDGEAGRLRKRRRSAIGGGGMRVGFNPVQGWGFCGPGTVTQGPRVAPSSQTLG
jgi:hypothetical protein